MMKRFVILLASFLCSLSMLHASFSPFLTVRSGGAVSFTKGGEEWLSPELSLGSSVLDFSVGPIALGLALEGSYQGRSIVRKSLLLPCLWKASLGLDVCYRKKHFQLPFNVHGGLLYYPTLLGAEPFWGVSLTPSYLLAERLSVGLELGLDRARSRTAVTMALSFRLQGGTE